MKTGEKRMTKGWIGVDLDGTTFEYHTWMGWNVFGAPIPLMVARIRKWWYEEDRDVRVVTARVGLPTIIHDIGRHGYSAIRRQRCRVTGEMFSDEMMVDAIGQHFNKHVGFVPVVQCHKDLHMIELWDDRAVQVVPNTGMTLAEEHAAELSALRGKQFGSR